MKQRMPKSEQRKWIEKLDKVFSIYVRMRDSKEFHHKYFRCISCGRVLPIEKADAGHYVGRANMSVRFNEDNVNSECSWCNRFQSSHLLGYRRNLIGKLGMMEYKRLHPSTPINSAEVKRLGEQKVDLLEIMGHQSRKWSVFELQQLYKYYAALVVKMKEEEE